MALVDKAVITAALGYVFIAPVGTAAPAPTALKTIKPGVFGADTSYTLKLKGTPTGGTFTLTAATTGTGAATATTAAIAWNASAEQVRSELEKLSTIGTGNVQAAGVDMTDAAGVEITLVGKHLTGSGITITSTPTLTGGTTPSVEVTKTALAAGGGWVNIGHTSRDDLPEFGYDGGDTETRGSWQNASLREVVTDQAADYCIIRLMQFTNDALELYYGRNASTTPGVFGVPTGTQVPQEHALFIVIVDGTTKLGFHASKASFRRDDSITMAVDEFAILPVRATFMDYGTSAIKYSWIEEDFFA